MNAQHLPAGTRYPECLGSPEWDAVVIGGGPAGLQAALMLGRARYRTLVVDSGSPRNRFAAHMHGVLGNEGAAPAELVARGREEAARYGVQFIDGVVDRVCDATPHRLRVTLASSATHETRALIVASGMSDELPAIPGLAERWGATVLHCPFCHGWEVADRRIGVLAASGTAIHQAQMLRQWSERVTLFAGALHPLDPALEARLRSRGIEIVTAPVVEISGEGTRIDAVRTEDGGEFAIDALFTMGGVRLHDGFLVDLGLTRVEMPFGMGSVLAVDAVGRTSHPRIWAVGNVVNPAANVPMSIGAGAAAGGAVAGALVEWDFDAAAG